MEFERLFLQQEKQDQSSISQWWPKISTQLLALQTYACLKRYWKTGLIRTKWCLFVTANKVDIDLKEKKTSCTETPLENIMTIFNLSICFLMSFCTCYQTAFKSQRSIQIFWEDRWAIELITKWSIEFKTLNSWAKTWFRKEKLKLSFTDFFEETFRTIFLKLFSNHVFQKKLKIEKWDSLPVMTTFLQTVTEQSKERNWSPMNSRICVKLNMTPT